jgi:hypothetical protein
MQRPEAGAMVRDSGGVRKLRWTEPRKFPAVLGSFESIDRAAAEDRRDDTSIVEVTALPVLCPV